LCGFFLYVCSMTLHQYITELQNLQNNVPKLVHQFVNERSNYLLGNVKLRFYNRGIDGDGNKIGSYTKNTKERKKRKPGKYTRTSHVTLADSGNWYDNLFVTYEQGHLFLDNRMRNLTQKLIEGGGDKQNPPYGDAILEFTKDEIDVFTSAILIDLGEHLQKIFNTNIDLEI